MMGQGGNMVGQSHTKELGFTLIELMMTLVISMVIMAGLLLLFLGQSNEYSYQNKRVDAAQDIEFVLNYIADDLRLGLVSSTGTPAPTENNNFGGVANSTLLEFDVWVDPNSDEYINATAGVKTQISGNSYRAKRKYVLLLSDGNKCFAQNPVFKGKDYCLRYDREATGSAAELTSNDEMLRGITMFKIFNDTTSTTADRGQYVNIPPALPKMNVGGFGEGRSLLTSFTATAGTVEVQDSSLPADTVDGYTILLEIAVDSAYEGGAFLNAKGVDVKTLETPARKRIVRYIQVYPMATVP